MSDIAADQLRSIVDRILNCREAEDEAKEATRRAYADAEAAGFDKTMLGLRVRRARQEGRGLRVYFAAFPRAGLLKIGVSGNVPRRLKQIAAINGEAPDLLLTMPGIFAIEGWYHAIFHPWRVSGEWFQLCPETIALIKKVEADGPVLKAATA